MNAVVPDAEAKEYLSVDRVFVPKGTDPFSTLEWKKVDAVIVNSKGKEVFRQNEIEVPSWWGETQINVVAEKYFRVVKGVKENSARQMFHRVAFWLALNGVRQGVFEGEHGMSPSQVDSTDMIPWFKSEAAQAFYDELVYMGLHGMHAFNSPVWFNVGVREGPPVLGLLHPEGRPTRWTRSWIWPSVR
jgi:ribonucleoside-diphosphate reductase alpha chain